MTATADAPPRRDRNRRRERPGSGFLAVLGVQWRTGWAQPVAWVVSLLAGYFATVAAIDGAYGTPEQLATYEQTVASDPAMAAINGTPYGAGTLGGVVANEFGFIAAIAIPLMGLSLVVRHTRRSEEEGLLELLRSRSVGARAPWLAASLVAVVSLVIVGVGQAITLVAFDVPAGSALLYGASIAALGAVFAGFAVFAGQLFRHASGVTSAGVVLLGSAYVTRAVGDVRDTGWEWLSPLAWQQETRPFTDEPRIWPLLLSVAVATVLFVAGSVLVGRRDLGAAVVPARPGPARAARWQASRLALALRSHGPAGLAWIAGAWFVGFVFGAFTDDIAEAVLANPELSAVLGTGGTDSLNGAYVAFTIVLVVLMALGCLAQAVGRIRAVETGGLLEPILARSVSRVGWVLVEVATATVAAMLVVLAGGAGVAMTAGDEVDGIPVASFAYLPAVLVFAGFAVLLFGFAPRATGLVWAAFGWIAFVAVLGETVDLPDWAAGLSPVHAVGGVPVDEVSAGVELALLGVGLVLSAAGAFGFRRRDLPR